MLLLFCEIDSHPGETQTMKAVKLLQTLGYPDVINVKDATSPVTLEIRPSDIKSAGKRKSPCDCPIAKACKRQFGVNITAAVIYPRVAYLIKGNEAVRFGIPESARKELSFWDRGGEFDPGSYHLSKPARKLGAQRKTGPKNTGVKVETTPRHVTQGVREMFYRDKLNDASLGA